MNHFFWKNLPLVPYRVCFFAWDIGHHLGGYLPGKSCFSGGFGCWTCYSLHDPSRGTQGAQGSAVCAWAFLW